MLQHLGNAVQSLGCPHHCVRHLGAAILDAPVSKVLYGVLGAAILDATPPPGHVKLPYPSMGALRATVWGWGVLYCVRGPMGQSSCPRGGRVG